jgi:ketosteroid isomerase-like protein
MNSPLRIAALLLFAGTSAIAADPKSDVEKAERGWAAASLAADVPALERLLASDLVYTHSGGARDTHASFIDSVRSGKLKYETLTHQAIEVHMVKNDVAFVTARAEVRVLSAGKPIDMKVSLLHVFVKRQGRWQLLAHQSAKLP